MEDENDGDAAFWAFVVVAVVVVTAVIAIIRAAKPNNRTPPTTIIIEEVDKRLRFFVLKGGAATWTIFFMFFHLQSEEAMYFLTEFADRIFRTKSLSFRVNQKDCTTVCITVFRRLKKLKRDCIMQ